jgi:hypothetical protein
MITLQGDHPAILNARKWLREELSISSSQHIDVEFTQYFGCDVKRTRVDRPADYIFHDDKEATAFLLRWV